MKGKRIFGIFLITLVAIGLVSFNFFQKGSDSASNPQGAVINTSSSTGSKPTDVDLKGKKVLVVFFSRTKGLYGGDTPAIGNTHKVANLIQEATGADMYEIVPEKEYPDEYRATTEVAKEEQANNERPKIKNPLPDVSQYDVVFVGGPIWWGEYPMVVRTFLDSVDLNGKTVIPFTTHEGSGMGNTKEQLISQYPNARVLDGIAIRGRQAGSDETKTSVNNWLKQLGF